MNRLAASIAVAVSAFLVPTIASAADAAAAGGEQSKWFIGPYGFWWLVGTAGSVLALMQAFQFFKWMESQPAGSQKMIDIAGYVRTGADAYLKQQYKVVAGFFLVIFLLLLILAFALEVQSPWVPFAFISGGLFSGLAGWFGMKTATLASKIGRAHV